MATSDQKSAPPSALSDEQVEDGPMHDNGSATDGDPPAESPVETEKHAPMPPAGDPVVRTDPKADGILILPSRPTDEPAPSWSELLVTLRQFHHDTAGAEDPLPRPDAALLPAALHPYRDTRHIRHDFPLVLLTPGPDEDGPYALPLADLMGACIASLGAGGDEFRMLKDNAARLEVAIRTRLDTSGTRGDLVSCLRASTDDLEESLALQKDSAKQLHREFEALIDALPGDAVLLPLTERTPLDLMLHVVRHRAARRHERLVAEASELAGRLRDLLRADDVKSESGRAPAALADAVGDQGAARLDPDRLARVLGPSRGVATMNPVERSRIEETIEVLTGFATPSEAPDPMVVCHPDLAVEDGTDGIDWHLVESGAVCAVAASLFDDIAARYAKVFGALRIARLELARKYDPARHEAMCSSFDWRSFALDERLALPPIVAVESADHLVRSGLHALSGQLLSGRAVQTIVIVQAAANPGRSKGDDPLQGYRFELGYLGISHREAEVNQSTAARPIHLIDGYLQGLKSGRAGLHVVASGLTAEHEGPVLGAWMHTSAALEGRAHPLFHYDPDAGQSWARRLSFSANPEAEVDWPTYQLCYREDGTETKEATAAFTFADFALLEPSFRDHFRCLPEGVSGEELVGVDEYLERSPDEAAALLPFIWAADADGRLHRLVISQRLAFACRDRLDYWRTLQELAGIRNEYVREAVEREQERLTADFEEQRRELEETHAAELEQVRTEAAAESFQRLAQALLRTDASSLASAMVGSASAAAALPAPAPSDTAVESPPDVEIADIPEPVQEVEEEDEDDGGFDEPWIDSGLCTSCNDCMQVNPQVFVYNANKQATIGDPKAGTFAEIVKAAELCPAKCIHPGKPLNPNEPDLDDLVERARKFN